MPVAVVTDRTDGKLAHIEGLNIARAWMLEGIASALKDNDAGSHWLASFAVYLLSRRGWDRAGSLVQP